MFSAILFVMLSSQFFFLINGRINDVKLCGSAYFLSKKMMMLFWFPEFPPNAVGAAISCLRHGLFGSAWSMHKALKKSAFNSNSKV